MDLGQRVPLEPVLAWVRSDPENMLSIVYKKCDTLAGRYTYPHLSQQFVTASIGCDSSVTGKQGC